MSQGSAAVTAKTYAAMSNHTSGAKEVLENFLSPAWVMLGENIGLDLKAWEGQTWCSFMSSGPTSSGAENVFPVSTQHRAHVYITNTHVCGWSHRSQVGTQSTCLNQWPHPAPLSV